MKKAIVVTLLFAICSCSKPTPEQHMAKAQQLVEQKHPQAAILELKNAIQMAPNNNKARFQLGKLYMQQKMYNSAQKELSRAMKLGYPAAQVLPLLSVAMEKSKADVALSNIKLEQQGMDDNDAVKVAYYKLQSLIRLDKTAEARRLIRRIKLYKTDSEYKPLALAYQHVLDKDPQAALDMVETVLAKVPTQPQALQEKALLLLQLQKPKDAAAAYKLYLDYNPDDTETMFILAKLDMDAGNTKDAEPLVDKLLKINSDHPLLNFYKAAARFNDKDYKGALSYAEKSIAKDAAAIPVRLVAGYAAYALKDYQQAVDNLQLVASQLPQNHPALKVLAASQLKLGDNVAAADTLSKLSSPQEQDIPLFTSTSYELLKQGRREEARKLVAQSQKLGKTADQLAQFGILQLSLNNLQGISKLEKAVEMDPALAQAQLTLATAYLKSNQLDKASKLADKWQATDPQDFRPLMLKGLIAIHHQKFEQADKFYQMAKEKAPDNPYIDLRITELKILRQPAQDGQPLYQTLFKKHPDFTPAMASYLSYMRAKNRMSQASNVMQKQLAQQPGNITIRTLYGSSLLLDNQPQQAADVLQKAQQKPPFPEDYQRLLGVALLRSNQFKAAEEHYQKWLAARPESLQAVAGMLSIDELRNANQDGLALVNKSIKTIGDNAYLRLMRTTFEVRLGQLEQAKQDFQKLPKALQEKPVGKGLLAHFQLHDKHYQQALDNARVAYQDKPNPYNLRLLVMSLEATKQPADAIELLHTHLQAHPNDQIARMMLAERQLGQHNDQAIESYQTLIKQNPNNFLALNNLAYLYNQQGKSAQALDYAKQAVALHPADPNALDTLAQIQLTQGNTSAAVDSLAKAVNSKMVSEQVKLNYIIALLKDGQTPLAKRKISDYQFQQPAIRAQLDKIKQQYKL